MTTRPAAPSAADGDAEAPTLDRSGEVWVGEFPGLGRVEVAPDGATSITVESAPPQIDGEDDHPDAGEDPELREAALRHGWAEGLSWARRGFRMAGGAAVCPPADDLSCLVLSGDPHDVAIVLIQLVNQGWTVMGDKYTPTKWDDGVLVASARSAPVLISARRLAKASLEGTKVRAHTDSRAVELPRATGTRVVTAFCGLRMRKPDEDVLEVLTGSERFEAAATTMTGGALTPALDDAADEDAGDAAADAGEQEEAAADESQEEADARLAAERARLTAESMAEHLRLAAIPHLRLSIDSATAEDDAGRLIAWWDTLVGHDSGDSPAAQPEQDAP